MWLYAELFCSVEVKKSNYYCVCIYVTFIERFVHFQAYVSRTYVPIKGWHA